VTYIVTDLVERIRKLRRQTDRRSAAPNPVVAVGKKPAFVPRLVDQVIPHKRADDHHLRSSQF